ncbi:MAG: hypothetical protein A2493_03225 [Candidatus Magasanikbacteria bacterium RIFOXYC12_FULL_33_11]|uniref:Uncharacterized protein n=1 Tax=Candidatus Magasanikbacteria bacterium RIFOXYC12_FULL_33_11 TaxID=1798701 RepID=A0A1F6NS79_9BACT|nr:MAG: hypothetical protein A2493_03225 [Candidatus Magasanikbacteria bacterium RIFOXYC12_FULL_33_11]
MVDEIEFQGLLVIWGPILKFGVGPLNKNGKALLMETFNGMEQEIRERIISAVFPKGGKREKVFMGDNTNPLN